MNNDDLLPNFCFVKKSDNVYQSGKNYRIFAIVKFA